MKAPTRFAYLCAIALAPNISLAHSFGQTYTLPVPVWLYLYGATAALIASFVIVGYFVQARSVEANRRTRPLGPPSPHLVSALRCVSVAILALAIAAGLIGINHAYRNINMTLFWVIFCLGYTYLTALIGDWYAVLNPFRVVIDWLEKLNVIPLKGFLFNGHFHYRLSYWPALVLYATFIWLELFGRSTPYSLSLTLLGYLGINLLGCALIGKKHWFEYCEFFGVFLRLVAKISPIDVISEDGKITGLLLRHPCAGLIQDQKIPLSLLTFILFMLASTAFDGMHETALWVGAFWENLYQLVLIPIYGNAPPVNFESIQRLFLGYQSAALLISPFIYLAAYSLFLLAAKMLTRSPLTLRPLLGWFGYSLIPIAFAYHLTHYYTLLQVQGAQIVRLISNPFGLGGWNLFGTAKIPINIIPDMGFVWHTQVFVIIAGHVVSVYLAHQQALRVFPDRRSALMSQLPILALMVGFTAAGLWILSLPHSSGVSAH